MRVDHSVNTLSHTCSPPYISAHAAYTELYTLSLHDALPISSFLVVFNRPINILCRVSLFLSMALCLLLRLNKETRQDRKSGSAGMPRPISYAVFCLKKKKYRRNITSTQEPKAVRDSR